MNDTKEPELIRAAGGLLWRETEHGREIMIIHRPRYDDWSLPKGKLKAGERWEEAALREVAEETGYRPRLASFAGTTFYYHKGQPKIVLFWNMRVEHSDPSAKAHSDSPDEGDQTVWLSIGEAAKRLDYDGEIDLVMAEARRTNLI